jgi:hypothetical protein
MSNKSIHIVYPKSGTRRFWLTNNVKSRNLATKFLRNEPGPFAPVDANHAWFLYDGLLKLGSGKITVHQARAILRFLVQYHRVHGTPPILFNVLKYKLLEFCMYGISEAYLTFYLLFPHMCNSRIQPWFNFKGKFYSDDHWYTLLYDPDFGPLASEAYYMSGFNRMWRLERPHRITE